MAYTSRSEKITYFSKSAKSTSGDDGIDSITRQSNSTRRRSKKSSNIINGGRDDTNDVKTHFRLSMEESNFREGMHNH